MTIAGQIFRGGNSRPISFSFRKTKFNMFFTTQEVQRAFTPKEQRILGGTGAFTRGFMRRLIRKAGKRYDAKKHRGEPPRYHTRGFVSLKDGIFFFANLETSSVIIGPNLLKGTNVRSNKASGAELQDVGGVGRMRVFRYNKPRTVKESGRFLKKTTAVGLYRPGKWEWVRARWRPRPYVDQSNIAAWEKMGELIQKYSN